MEGAKRDEILDAATRRFGRDGYENTRWADIGGDVCPPGVLVAVPPEPPGGRVDDLVSLRAFHRSRLLHLYDMNSYKLQHSILPPVWAIPPYNQAIRLLEADRHPVLRSTLPSAILK